MIDSLLLIIWVVNIVLWLIFDPWFENSLRDNPLNNANKKHFVKGAESLALKHRLDLETRLADVQSENNRCKFCIQSLQYELKQMKCMVGTLFPCSQLKDNMQDRQRSLNVAAAAQQARLLSHSVNGKSNFLMQRIRLLEEEKLMMMLENEEERMKYEHCLDKVTHQLIQVLLLHKNMRHECIKLHRKIMQLEKQNRQMKYSFQRRIRHLLLQTSQGASAHNCIDGTSPSQNLASRMSDSCLLKKRHLRSEVHCGDALRSTSTSSSGSYEKLCDSSALYNDDGREGNVSLDKSEDESPRNFYHQLDWSASEWKDQFMSVTSTCANYSQLSCRNDDTCHFCRLNGRCACHCARQQRFNTVHAKSFKSSSNNAQSVQFLKAVDRRFRRTDMGHGSSPMENGPCSISNPPSCVHDRQNVHVESCNEAGINSNGYNSPDPYSAYYDKPTDLKPENYVISGPLTSSTVSLYDVSCNDADYSWDNGIQNLSGLSSHDHPGLMSNSQRNKDNSSASLSPIKFRSPSGILYLAKSDNELETESSRDPCDGDCSVSPSKCSIADPRLRTVSSEKDISDCNEYEGDYVECIRGVPARRPDSLDLFFCPIRFGSTDIDSGTSEDDLSFPLLALSKSSSSPSKLSSADESFRYEIPESVPRQQTSRNRKSAGSGSSTAANKSSCSCCEIARMLDPGKSVKSSHTHDYENCCDLLLAPCRISLNKAENLPSERPYDATAGSDATETHTDKQDSIGCEVRHTRGDDKALCDKRSSEDDGYCSNSLVSSSSGHKTVVNMDGKGQKHHCTDNGKASKRISGNSNNESFYSDPMIDPDWVLHSVCPRTNPDTRHERLNLLHCDSPGFSRCRWCHQWIDGYRCNRRRTISCLSDVDESAAVRLTFLRRSHSTVEFLTRPSHINVVARDSIVSLTKMLQKISFGPPQHKSSASA